MLQLHRLVDSIKKGGVNEPKFQKTVICDLVNKRQLVETLFDILIYTHKLALDMWQHKNIKMEPVVLPGAAVGGCSSNNLPVVQSFSILAPNAGKQCEVH